VLADLGHESEVLDYRSDFIESHYTPSLLGTLKSPRRLGIALLRNGYMRDRRSIFEEFVREHIRTSEPLTSDQLAAVSHRYGVLMAGSDQVWNYRTAGFDPNYFLSFAGANSKKTAYAASLGISEIPENLRTRYWDLLKDYSGITMRE
ncbi:polysaccharide pyruvyl transferase family protein, partial [Escherichia coli]|uniref:polysaccharide pyruvyl transferase family protein n=1 Tax=Escherichia coli TaxID=562 RepID=UPI001929D94D